MVRICQFHIIQAILRWLNSQLPRRAGSGLEKPRRSRPSKRSEDSDLEEAEGERFSANKELIAAILDAFRELQRCRTAQDWPAAHARFEAAVLLAVSENPATNEKPGVGDKILDYFASTWFNDTWRGTSSH